jgi:hypothetical protein
MQYNKILLIYIEELANGWWSGFSEEYPIAKQYLARHQGVECANFRLRSSDIFQNHIKEDQKRLINWICDSRTINKINIECDGSVWDKNLCDGQINALCSPLASWLKNAGLQTSETDARTSGLITMSLKSCNISSPDQSSSTLHIFASCLLQHGFRNLKITGNPNEIEFVNPQLDPKRSGYCVLDSFRTFKETKDELII